MVKTMKKRNALSKIFAAMMAAVLFMAALPAVLYEGSSGATADIATGSVEAYATTVTYTSTTDSVLLENKDKLAENAEPVSTMPNGDGTYTYTFYITKAIIEFYETHYTIYNSATDTYEFKTNKTASNYGFRRAIWSYANRARRDTSGNRYYLKVEAGNYTLDGTLYLFGNTTLDVTGSTITADSGASKMIEAGFPYGAIANEEHLASSFKNMFDTSAVQYTSVGELKNIAVIGGTWDRGTSTVAAPMFQMAYVKGLTVSGVTLKNGYNNHLMEIAACDTVSISGCTFADMRYDSTVESKAYAREALQIDVSGSAFGPYNVNAGSNNNKYTFACTNVEISYCAFSNVVQGVGSHTNLAGSKSHSNIKIHDNAFLNITKSGYYENDAIHMYGWKNSAIYNNNFNTIGVTAVAVVGDCTGTSVYANTITDTGNCGVSVRSGATIKNIYSNKISSTGAESIYVNSATVGKIYSNTITGCKATAIWVSGATASVSKICKNTIKKPAKDGIYVTKATVTKIYSNTIKMAVRYGIFLNSGATVSVLKTNTIAASNANPTKVGINLKSATATKVISNTLKKCTKYGVKIYSKSVVDKFGKSTYKKCSTKYLVKNSTIKKYV